MGCKNRTDWCDPRDCLYCAGYQPALSKKLSTNDFSMIIERELWKFNDCICKKLKYNGVQHV